MYEDRCIGDVRGEKDCRILNEKGKPCYRCKFGKSVKDAMKSIESYESLDGNYITKTELLEAWGICMKGEK